MREDAHHQLRLGDKYSKQELSKILRETAL
jgi:hypothetical protein